MSDTAWIVGGIVVVVLAIVTVLGAKLGFINVSFLGGAGISAGQNRGSASADDAEAGRDLIAKTGAGGKATADRGKAGRDLKVTSS